MLFLQWNAQESFQVIQCFHWTIQEVIYRYWDISYNRSCFYFPVNIILDAIKIEEMLTFALHYQAPSSNLGCSTRYTVFFKMLIVLWTVPPLIPICDLLLQMVLQTSSLRKHGFYVPITLTHKSPAHIQRKSNGEAVTITQ